ncbi:hypothetical protein ACF1DY_02040 [Streptomyces albus]
MQFDLSRMRACYYVSGVGQYGSLHASLDDALAAADTVNATAGTDDSGRGLAFVVPAMVIVYPPPDPEPDPTPDPPPDGNPPA